jgi:hypothetical protein
MGLQLFRLPNVCWNRRVYSAGEARHITTPSCGNENFDGHRVTFPSSCEGMKGALSGRLLFRRGDALACSVNKYTETRVCVQGLEMVVFLQMIDIAD